MNTITAVTKTATTTSTNTAFPVHTGGYFLASRKAAKAAGETMGMP
jgi:hypothetical protein